MGSACSSSDGAYDGSNDTDPMLSTEGGGAGHRGKHSERNNHNQDFGSASMAEVGAMSDQVVYLTAHNSRLTQQVEELKSKLAKQKHASHDGSEKDSKDAARHSTNNIEVWTLAHLTFVCQKYGVSIDKASILGIVKKLSKIRGDCAPAECYNNCKKIVKDWIQANAIKTIPGSVIIKVALVQTGFHLEKKNNIKELRKVGTIARVSDDTLQCVSQSIERQKSLESVYNQVYDF